MRQFSIAHRPGLMALLWAWLVVTGMLASPGAARADLSPAKKRELMARIRLVAVIPPYFGVAPPGHNEVEGKAGAEAKPAVRSDGKQDAKLADYISKLRKLSEHAAVRLPERVAARTPYTVISAEEVEAALKALDLTPQQLFQNGGKLKDSRYPDPDLAAARKLTARLHADALLIGVLDEPRRNNGHYSFNPLQGIDYRSAQVQVRARFSLVTADGTEAMRAEVDAVHPLTHIGNREYLLADWTETEDVVFEDLLDEWNRYTPEKPLQPGK